MPSEVEAVRAGQAPSGSACCVDRCGYPEPSVRLIGRIRRAARTIPIIAVSASVLATLCLVHILAGSAVQATALAALSLAVLGAVGFAGLRAHTALAARLDILAAALDAVPEAQLVVAADGRAVFANVAFQRIFPDKSEATLEHIEQILATDPQALNAFDHLSSRLAEDAQADATTAACDTCDGVAGGFRWSAAQLAGQPGYRLWSLRAVSDSNQTEAPPGDERLEGAAPMLRELFQRLFANAPVGMAVVDRFGRFIEANRAAGELFCASPQELVGGELISLLNEGERAAITARLAAAADGEVDREPIEIRLKRPCERTIVLLLSRFVAQGGKSSPLPTASGDSPATDLRGNADSADLMLYLIDVTEQKNLEAQFSQSQKMQAVGQLAGGVAHDFNNLLTAIIGFCDLLLLRSRPGDPAFADIMQIKQNANRAANLVRQLLAFSRQQTLQPRVIDITDVLVELSHLLRRLIGENIELEFGHGRDLGLVKVDQGQLEQVVINLAVNARDAMPNGGRLTIRTANVRPAQALRRGHEVMPAGDYVLIEVGRHRDRDRPRQSRADIRAVLLDQGGGLGDRPRPIDGLRHRQADRRFCLCRQQSWYGNSVRDLSAAPSGQRARGGRLAPRPPSRRVPKDLTGTGTVMLGRGRRRGSHVRRARVAQQGLPGDRGKKRRGRARPGSGREPRGSIC